MITNNRIPGAAPDCCINQLEPGNRSDIINFISEPLKKDLIIAGGIEVHLFVSSTANATSFTVKIIEMISNGESINVVDDITDIRWIDENKIEDYSPGSIRELIIKTSDIYWNISSGSKLRIDISSSNFPFYNIHPNFDKIWSETSEKIISEQTVYTGGKYKSRIIIPNMMKEKKKTNKTKIIIIVSITLLSALIIALICFALIYIYRKKKADSMQSSQFQDILLNSNQDKF